MTPLAPAALVQVADTVVMVTAAGRLDTLSSVADVVLAGLMIVFVIGLMLLLVQLRRMQRRVQVVLAEFQKIDDMVRELFRRLQRQVDPLLDRSKVVMENAEYISATVRHDVEKLNDSVRGLKARLDLASTRMEERIEEFNALMEMVQDEAEDIFVGTAATVKGVRVGARTLAKGDGSGPALAGGRSTAPAPDEGEAEAADAGVAVTGSGRRGPTRGGAG